MRKPTDGAQPGPTVVYEVDDLIVDMARARVTRNGVELPLPKLSLDFLVALIEAAPSVVSLDALMDQVWVGIVVSPETVSQRAKLLRDALGDDSKSPRYFTSVRSRGYRLIATVTRRTEPEPAMAPSLPSLPRERRVLDDVEAAPMPAPRRSHLRIPLTLGLVGAVLFGGWFAATRYEQRTPTSSTPAARAAAKTTEPSVAVLRFTSPGGAGDGDVLAFGIAEAVLHQLANLQGVVVISRTSSFALGAEPGDARAIGRTLDVRYLLEGSVQQAGGLLRVTAQLIDASTGAHVWSMRFDRPVSDIFAVQDDIAAQVAKALQLTTQPDAASHLAGQGTASIEAYLAYLQGRSLLATRRIGDGTRAMEQFRESLRLDPKFVSASVSLAEADVFAAEFSQASGRSKNFERAAQRALGSIEKALALDPGFGPAYLLRGYLEAFTDLDQAEASYRRGLQLSPNDARGFAGLAAVLFEQPAKREEALRLLDRARRIDPLEPTHDVMKAVFLLYDRGDVQAAEGLLRNVLQRQPQFVPAVVRLGELAWCCEADASGAIELLERAVVLDPSAQWPRRPLVRAYLDAGDLKSAEAIVAASTSEQSVLRLPLLAYTGDWLRAGEASYAALDEGLVTPIDELAAVIAIRRHARLTGQYERAIPVLEAIADVSWDADGSPRVPQRPGLRVASIGLADMLQAGGHPARARALLDQLIAQMGAEMRMPGRSETWYWHGMSVALALRGQPERALTWLRRGVELKPLAHDYSLVIGGDPAFDSMRSDPEFRLLDQRVRDVAATEAKELAQLRASGRVPLRD